MCDTPDQPLDPPDTGWIEECRDCGCDVHVDELIGPVLCEDCIRKSLERRNENPLRDALMSIARCDEAITKLESLPMFKRQAE